MPKDGACLLVLKLVYKRRVPEGLKTQYLRKLRNDRKTLKLQRINRPVPGFPLQSKSFVNASKQLLKNRSQTFPGKCYCK